MSSKSRKFSEVTADGPIVPVGYIPGVFAASAEQRPASTGPAGELLPGRTLGNIVALMQSPELDAGTMFSPEQIGTKFEIPNYAPNFAPFDEAVPRLFSASTWTSLLKLYQDAVVRIWASIAAPKHNARFESLDQYADYINSMVSILVTQPSMDVAGQPLPYRLKIKAIDERSARKEYAVTPLFVVLEMISVLIGFGVTYDATHSPPAAWFADQESYAKFRAALSLAITTADYLSRFIGQNVKRAAPKRLRDEDTGSAAEDSSQNDPFRYVSAIVGAENDAALRLALRNLSISRLNDFVQVASFTQTMVDIFEASTGTTLPFADGKFYDPTIVPMDAAPAEGQASSWAAAADPGLPAAAAAADPGLPAAAAAAAAEAADDDAPHVQSGSLPLPDTSPIIASYANLMADTLAPLKAGSPNYIKDALVILLGTEAVAGPLEETREKAANAIANARTPLAREQAWVASIQNELLLMWVLWNRSPLDVRKLYVAALQDAASEGRENRENPGIIREYLNIQAHHLKVDLDKSIFQHKPILDEFLAELAAGPKGIKAQTRDQFFAAARRATRGIADPRENFTAEVATPAALSAKMYKEIFPPPSKPAAQPRAPRTRRTVAGDGGGVGMGASMTDSYHSDDSDDDDDYNSDDEFPASPRSGAGYALLPKTPQVDNGDDDDDDDKSSGSAGSSASVNLPMGALVFDEADDSDE